MNKVVRTSAIMQFEGLYKDPSQLKHSSFFHSSPFLERRRLSNQASRFSNYYSKRSRKLNGKRELLRNVGAFAEELFQSWRDHHEYQPSFSKTHPWFRQEFISDRNRERRSRSRGPKPGSGTTFDFCKDDRFKIEDRFRAAFGGNKHFFWSFTSDEPEREYRSSFNTRSQRNWKDQFEDEYNSSEDSDSSAADLTSYRLALGLNASGPLNLENVKSAYRTCALKWHPDRHQGSSKVVAEEKFKICSDAYQSLCHQLTMN